MIPAEATFQEAAKEWQKDRPAMTLEIILWSSGKRLITLHDGRFGTVLAGGWLEPFDSKMADKLIDLEKTFNRSPSMRK